MKKSLLLLLLFVAFQVSAQEFHFIPKIGLNFANMTNSDGSMKPGLNIGVAGEVMMTDHFAIEPGIFYSMQGTKGKDSGVTMKIKNDYLNIPVLFKGYVYEGFNLFAGPQLGFKVSSKIKASQSGTSVSTSEGSDLFKTVDFAIVIGAGYQSPMGFLVSLNYNIGLANTINKDKMSSLIGATVDEKSRNGVLQFNVGWRF
ncbi:porin family protein [uncultured Parabacteroides sp.]|uniref:porin family protein n=1 Tax=uncultured Parabacteroides sp. TaxID=512312 RepID=UPI0025840A3F|nr:porin family protein [uncultured Parabacteroides sp.]